MNRDLERLDPSFGQDNLALDTLTAEELATYRNGVWVRGTKVPPTKTKRSESPSLVDAQPFGVIVRNLVDHRHYSRQQLALFADVGFATIRDLYDGKASVQQGTADKLARLVQLLPSGVESA